MTADDIAAALEFTHVRRHSPQWDVTLDGRKVARVTERYVAIPPFALTLIDADGVEWAETTHADRDEVMAAIVAHVGKGPV